MVTEDRIAPPPPPPSKATVARRRNAAARRELIMRTGRRIDLMLPEEPSSALAEIEKRTKERPTQIIARLLLAEGRRNGRRSNEP